MKKFLFGTICVLSFVLMVLNLGNYKKDSTNSGKNEQGYRESFNDEEKIYIARSIAAMTHAERVAVIENENGVLVGIALKSGTGNRSALRKNAEELMENHYKNKKIVIEIQSDKSEKIFSLASYLEKGIPENILSARISYLLEH